MENKYLIGLNIALDSHNRLSTSGNGNGVLFRNNTPIVGIAEERLSRKKYDGGIRHTLNLFHTEMQKYKGTLEAVCISCYGLPLDLSSEQEDNIKNIVRDNAPWDYESPIFYIKSHHEAHALTGLCQQESLQQKTLVIVIDHTGSILDSSNDPTHVKAPIEQVSYFYWDTSKLELIDRDYDRQGEVGFGRMFSKVTRYCGFKSYNEAGKLMGLSSFGNPHAFPKCDLSVMKDGRLFCDMTRAEFSEDGIQDLINWFSKHGYNLPKPRKENEALQKIHMDIAAWLQFQVGKALVSRIRHLAQNYDFDAICITGGVALNSVLNSYIADAFTDKSIYIPPSPADAGISLGAPLKYLQNKTGEMPHITPQIYFGPEYNNQDYENALALIQDSGVYEVQRDIDPIKEAVRLLKDNKIIGWFQGCSEYGPRSLGARSILSSPHNSWTKEILNSQLKLREWFRPYAPSLCLDAFSTTFDSGQSSPYMMQIAKVNAEAKMSISACVHVDGTSRHHTVTQNSNPLFYALIKRFQENTGIPAVLNTSFNLNNMPIVETPSDAMECFIGADGMAALILGNILITKKTLYEG